MATIVISALLLSFIIYLSIGFANWKHTKGLADMIPVVFGRTATVKTHNEFSASTVATTISLATVIMAYFELSGYFGLWLLWTALTTSVGLAVVSKMSGRIWKKLSEYDHRPSMHEYLGTQFNSKSIALAGAFCTSIGFLLIYATELIVGSQFLARLIPEIPEQITVVVLSIVGFLYTVLGGFRAVIKTDQIQMKFIWVFIFIMLGFYVYFVWSHEGLSDNLQKLPSSMYDFSGRPGLISFLFGIAVMNIPLFISNMSIWQRIAGAKNPEVVGKGLQNSVWGSFISWSLLALIACLAYMVVTPQSNVTLFTDLMTSISTTVIGRIVLFFTVLGLYGAMLSTASTNLIVVAHTIYEDIYAAITKKELEMRVNSSRELVKSRVILIVCALGATGLVLGLKAIGFSIADLAFSIYGGGLALCPSIIYSIFKKKSFLFRIRSFAIASIIGGFMTGWSSAIIGKIFNLPDLIFLSPCISFGISLTILMTGVFITPKNAHENFISQSSDDIKIRQII